MDWLVVKTIEPRGRNDEWWLNPIPLAGRGREVCAGVESSHTSTLSLANSQSPIACHEISFLFLSKDAPLLVEFDI